MSGVSLPNGRNQFDGIAGAPATGYKVYTYIPGTSTPKATYTTSVANVPNANPIILDSRGEAAIYWVGDYDITLKTAADVTVWGPERLNQTATQTDFIAFEAALADTSNVANGDALVGVKKTATGAVATTQHEMNERALNALDMMTPTQIADVISGTGAVDVTVAVQAAMDAGFKRVFFPRGSYRLSSLITVPATVSFRCEGIGFTNFVQVTANTGGFKWADASLAYLDCGGFTLTGAGRGAASSIGIEMGRSTRGTFYCTLSDIEVTNFGVTQVKVINGYRCQLDRIYAHGDPTGVLGASAVGLYMLGTFAFAGSNYDNRIGYVEAYNNETDIKCELGGKNNFDKVYTYNQLYTGTVHHIHEVDSSLNSWNRPHVEPLSLAAGGGALWLIESTATNPYTYMLGPFIKEMEYENGTLGTTVNVIQIGTGAGGIVYGTQIEWGKFMPVSAGKFHVIMTNEQSTRIAQCTHRNNSSAFDRILRDLTISNPNAATNHSYIGSPYEDSYGTWTPVLFVSVSGAAMATLTGTFKWSRVGNTIKVWCDATLSAKNANTGNVTLRGCEAISPNGGTTIFAPVTGSAIPVTCTVFNGSSVRQAYNAYFSTSNSFINFLVDGTGAAVTEAGLANSYQIILQFEFPVS